MLTTTLDGLWVLQVLAGIEVLAPELGLRPYLPSAETRDMVLGHPAAEELRSAEVLDAEGALDETVLEWLTVLSRRDIAVLLCVQTPATETAPGGVSERILVARFAQWWVTLERFGDKVRISGAGTATNMKSAAALVSAQIERFCGRMLSADLKPVTIEVAEILSAVRDSVSLERFLVDRKFDPDQLALLTLAADPARSAQASLVATQCGATSSPGRTYVEPTVVTIIDTPRGRLVSEQVTRSGKNWMIVSPGTPGTIASAILAMLHNLPAGEQWYSHRKAV